MNHPLRAFLPGIFMALLGATPTFATTQATWNDSGTSWGTATDWSPNTVPNYVSPSNVPYAVDFNVNGSTMTQPIVDGDYGVYQLNFGVPLAGSNWDITPAGSGDYLQFVGGSGGGIYSTAITSGTITIGSNIVMSSTNGTQGQSWATGTGSSLVISGNVSGTTGASMSFGSSTIGAQGTVELNGNNSFVNAGSSINSAVTLGNANGLGASTNNLQMHSGYLDLEGYNVTVGELYGSSYHAAGNIQNSGSGTATITVTNGNTTGVPVYNSGYATVVLGGGATGNGVGLTIDISSTASNQSYGLTNGSASSTNTGATTVEGGNVYLYQFSTSANNFFGGALSVTGTSSTSSSMNLATANAGYYMGTGTTVSGYDATHTGTLTSAAGTTYYLSGQLTLQQYGIINPGGTSSEVAFSLGAPTGAASNSFTMTGGTLQFDLGDTSATSSDKIATLTFAISGGTLALTRGADFSYSDAYQIFTGTGTVTGLTITGYDTTDYTAALSNTGDLIFAPSRFLSPVHGSCCSLVALS